MTYVATLYNYISLDRHLIYLKQAVFIKASRALLCDGFFKMEETNCLQPDHVLVEICYSIINVSKIFKL